MSRLAAIGSSLVFAVLVAAPPVLAQEAIAYGTQGVVPAVCEVSGQVLPVADDTTTAIVVAPGGLGATDIALDVSTDQVIGGVSARCNGGGATITINSANSFRLINGGGGDNQNIPYQMRVPGTSLAGGFSVQSSFVEPAASGSGAPNRQLMVNVGAVDFSQLLAGVYIDTITLSVTPNS